MLNLYPRPVASSSHGGGGDDDDDGYRVFYGIAVVCLSIFMFCVLAASVTIWKACAFAAMAALLLSVVGCFAPRRWFRRRGRPAASSSVELPVTMTAPGWPRAPAPAKAPPAFAYVCPIVSDVLAGAGDGKQAAAAGCVMCSVCLEDVLGGEMVRRLPACKHIFHVGCIDMWLHSHWTCPTCRCVVSPPATVTAKAAVPEEAPESSAEPALPPV